ncbi:golgin subfamily A member 6-like protein 24 [Elgaria multicarinata webbii]|uniref:golgin subfamily A member 6-like protein 24 n=1 Tax=Elgaria multicarinata webbii TaxID=159646 RepID=UPI002FCD69EE
MRTSLDLSSSRSPLRGYNRGFLCSRHPPRVTSLSPQRGTHTSNMGLTNGTEYGGQHPNSLALRRRHSLSPLPSGDAGEHSPTWHVAGRVRSGSVLDLCASLPGETQRKSSHREARRAPQGPSEEHRERNLELELNLMQFELLSLKQKQMKSSFAHLEKEKKWLETNRSEERKQKGDLRDTVFSLETELARAGPYFSERDPGWPRLDSSPTAAVEKDRLEEEVNMLSLKLAPAVADRERLLQEKVSLPQQVQNLTLELERAQKKQEVFNNQVLALHSELISAKTQVSHLEKEKVLMKEELESVRQANKELSSEVAESRQRLEASLVELYHLEAEKKILDNHIQALEDERLQLLGKKEERLMDVRHQEEEEEEEEEEGALRECYENLKESQALLQREKVLLETRCLDLEEALHAKQEEMDSRLAEEQQACQDLTTEEGELESAAPRSSTHSAKYRECRSEKQRLEERVTSLEEQLAEKEQAWRDRKQMKNVDRSEPESKTSSLELKGRREQFSLTQQQRLVTEQLKDLFSSQRRRQEAGPRAHPGGLQGKSAVAPCKPAGMLAAADSARPLEGAQPGSLAHPSSEGEAQSLQQQPKETAETMSSMASEIQALRQKNESLMKAKLRFQQQIQEIRNISKQQPERSSPEMLVPRLSVSWQQDLQSDSSEAPPQSDESASSVHGGESPATVPRDIQLHSGTEDKRSHASSTAAAAAAAATTPLWPTRPAASPLPSHSDLSDTGAATSLHDPRRPAEGEGAFLCLQGSVLLSPRPFGPQRPWSPFKFKVSPDAPEN